MAERPGEIPGVVRLGKWLVAVAAVLDLGAVVGEYGFYLGAAATPVVRVAVVVAAACLVFAAVLPVVVEGRKALTSARLFLATAMLFGGVLVFVRFFVGARPDLLAGWLRAFGAADAEHLYFVLLQGYILLSLMLHANRVSWRLAYSRLRPAQVLVGTFAALIAVGTLLLMLPRATPSTGSLPALDALFTATSAVCVTGLTVVNTATDFTRTGQLIIMLLFQIGGLGIMTFAAFFALLAGRGLGIKEGVMMREVMNVNIVSRISSLVFSLLAITFTVELAGAVAFFVLLPPSGASASTQMFTALFHAISGFCNAGFSVYPNGLEPLRGNVPVIIVMTVLIIAGGLGFTVHQDLLGGLTTRLRGRGRRSRLRLHSKIVLTMTVVLLLGGTASFLLLGRGQISILDAFFQSVTTRTAGFNTVPQATLDEGSQFLSALLMFIGAAPGSTGGGIKLTTVAILIATVMAMMRGRPQTEMFRKTLPDRVVRESIVVASLSAFAVSVSLMLLLITDAGNFRSLLFEVVSAFGTVGLSLGRTPELTAAGKLVVVGTMLFGRLGPMTIALALSGRVRSAAYSYPTERVMVG